MPHFQVTIRRVVLESHAYDVDLTVSAVNAEGAESKVRAWLDELETHEDDVYDMTLQAAMAAGRFSSYFESDDTDVVETTDDWYIERTTPLPNVQRGT